MRSRQQSSKRQKVPTDKGESLLHRKIIAPDKLKILVLAGNDLMAQHLDFLNKCTNLIKLDLSHNYISRLPEKLDLGLLTKLQVLFLHHNKVGALEAMLGVVKCQSLTYLTYHHNPLEVHIRNDHQLVNLLPNLKLINQRIVYLEERTDYLITERAQVFADVDMLENWKSVQNSQAYYLKVLGLQLQYIDNLWAFNNPIAILQRAWRHFLPLSNQLQPPRPLSKGPNASQLTSRRDQPSRNSDIAQKPHPLRKLFHQWKRFSEGLRVVRESMTRCQAEGKTVNKEYMLLPLEDYQCQLRNMRVNKPLVQFLGRIRRKIYERKMAKRLMVNIKLKQTIFSNQLSFYTISGIEEEHRFYYNKSQQHILDNFLVLIGQNFNKKEDIDKEATFGVASQFNAIRLVDPESFTNKHSGGQLHAICSMIWPSMKVIVSSRKVIPSHFKAGIIGIPQLSYIRNRDKVLTLQQYQKSLEVYRQLHKFAANEYQNSLWYFSCTDPFVMRQLLRMVYYHNAKAIEFQVKQRRNQMLAMLENFDQPFILYVDRVIRRSCAAVTIQKSWRKYISNKNQAESIYHKMKKNRAALHIQRFFRDAVYWHRQRFSKQLHQDLGRLKSKTLVLPLPLYMNLEKISPAQRSLALFKKLRISRYGHKLGLSEQFYRPIFQRKTRQTFFEGQLLGTQNYSDEVDLYNVYHHQVNVQSLAHQGQQFISFTFSTQTQANIAASLTALITYQLRGSLYFWPLTKPDLAQWATSLQNFKKVELVRHWIPLIPAQQTKVCLFRKEYKAEGLFLWQTDNEVRIEGGVVNSVEVEFYQKRYHNFPVKQTQTLSYTLLQSAVQQIKSQSIAHLSQTEPVRLNQHPLLFADEESPLSITMIDKKRFSMFENPHTIQASEPQEPLHGRTQHSYTQAEENRAKVMRIYQEESLKKQAQKDLKEGTLAGLRDRAKKEKVLNSTLRSLKEAERTENLRNKAQKIRQFKQRSAHKKEEEQFVQQNNFVMQQQLKMMVMRGRIKEQEGRRQQFLAKKASSEKPSERMSASRPSIAQRRSSRQRQRLEEDPNLLLEQTVGDEGSVVNAKKRTTRRSRGSSIGAYLRDPSFVHGVFPEEYYPIESRGTSFYFPPVV